MGAPNFSKDLLRGEAGEVMLKNLLPGLQKVSRQDQAKYDFFDSLGTYELKTDFYSLSSTKNFFHERFSDVARRTDGGVYRCSPEVIYLYLFYPDRVMYLFEAGQLRERIEKVKSGYSLIDVRNDRHITQGYAIPRELFKDIYQTVELSEDEAKKLGWNPKIR